MQMFSPNKKHWVVFFLGSIIASASKTGEGQDQGLENTGEYLDGPAPRSLDRFGLSLNGENVLVDTGTLNNRVPHPDATTLLIQVPNVSCSV